MEDFNYEEELTIDPDALDMEWLEQPKLFMKYSKAHADAAATVRELEEKLKVIRSDIILRNQKKGGDIKTTKDNLEAMYRVDALHEQTKREWVRASHRADILDGAVYAFHQRKAALEHLVILHGQNYFAGPRVPRDLAAVVRDTNALREENRIAVQRKIRQSMVEEGITKARRTK